jgi:hypothetical protein
MKMRRVRQFGGEVSAARVGGKAALVALYAAMVQSIDHYAEPVATGEQAELDFGAPDSAPTHDERADGLRGGRGRGEKEVSTASTVSLVQRGAARGVGRDAGYADIGTPEIAEFRERCRAFFEARIEVLTDGKPVCVFKHELLAAYLEFAGVKVEADRIFIVELHRWVREKLAALGWSKEKIKRFTDHRGSFMGRESRRLKVRLFFYKWLRIRKESQFLNGMPSPK